MQQELESIQAELAGHKARLEEVRAGIHDAKASNNREEWQQLQALELELLGVIRELQAKENRLSSQSAAAAAAAGGAPAAAATAAANQALGRNTVNSRMVSMEEIIDEKLEQMKQQIDEQSKQIAALQQEGVVQFGHLKVH
ncbi:hypothetical protein OEZ85_005876 [Tetradesmus obliquus]|uniref:Uncharacterized protein n=1 Tax=Tetradesmus obliquus TaxID=3088 RepID=A0ABY8UEW2_TETOB|nr:hypothetical protein OEZ85_005876 [Tetradesmus obliquus]